MLPGSVVRADFIEIASNVSVCAIKVTLMKSAMERARWRRTASSEGKLPTEYRRHYPNLNVLTSCKIMVRIESLFEGRST